MYALFLPFNLRRFLKEYKGKKLEDGKGLSRKGRLTNARIKATQNFYGRAIRSNKVNTRKMSKESNQFYIVMLALLANPCIHTNHKVIKVGEATKGTLLMEHLRINPRNVHYMRLHRN